MSALLQELTARWESVTLNMNNLERLLESSIAKASADSAEREVMKRSYGRMKAQSETLHELLVDEEARIAAELVGTHDGHLVPQTEIGVQRVD